MDKECRERAFVEDSNLCKPIAGECYSQRYKNKARLVFFSFEHRHALTFVADTLPLARGFSVCAFSCGDVGVEDDGDGVRAVGDSDDGLRRGGGQGKDCCEELGRGVDDGGVFGDGELTGHLHKGRQASARAVV